MSPSRGSGKERGLTFGSVRADKSAVGSSWASANAQAGAGRQHERGQALIEFALIAPLFLVIVVGIIQFGIGLNYWLDLNRLANQGARWAVVNCNPVSSGVCDPTLEDALENGVTSGGNVALATVCFVNAPPGGAAVGQPLRVDVNSEFTFLPILDLGTITLRAQATMRIEQPPTEPKLGRPVGTPVPVCPS